MSPGGRGARGGWSPMRSRTGRSRGGQGHASLEADRAPADRALVGLDHVLPSKLVLAGHSGVAPRSPRDRAGDVAAGSDGLTANLAENLVAALVRPHALARAAGQAVGEPDGLALKANAEPPLASQQQRSGQAEDRRLVAAIQLERASGARRGPCSLERARLTGAGRPGGTTAGPEHPAA